MIRAADQLGAASSADRSRRWPRAPRAQTGRTRERPRGVLAEARDADQPGPAGGGDREAAAARSTGPDRRGARCSASPTTMPTITPARSSTSRRSSTRCRADSIERREAVQVLGLSLLPGRPLRRRGAAASKRRAQWAAGNAELGYVLGQAYIQTRQPDRARAGFARTFGVAGGFRRGAPARRRR